MSWLKEAFKRCRSGSLPPVLMLLVLVLPFLILALYSLPQIDDYSTAARTNQRGIIDSQLWQYQNWNGRYLSSLLQSIPYFMGPSVYRILTLSMLSLLVISAYGFARVLLLGSKNVARDAAYVTFAFMSLLITLDLEIEATYWLSGWASYRLPIILLFSSGLFLHGRELDVKRRVLISIILFLVMGCHEIISVLVFTNIIVWTLYIFTKERKSILLRLKSLLVVYPAVVGFLIVLFSPGNETRSSRHGNSLSIFEIAQKTLIDILEHLLILALSPQFIGALVVIVVIFSRAPFMFSDKINQLREKRFLLLSCISSVVVVSLVPRMGLGDIYFRVESLSRLVVAISLIFAAYLLLNEYIRKIRSTYFVRLSFAFGFMIIVVSSLLSKNFQDAVSDIRDNVAKNYYMDNVALINQARSGSIDDSAISLLNFQTPETTVGLYDSRDTLALLLEYYNVEFFSSKDQYESLIRNRIDSADEGVEFVSFVADNQYIVGFDLNQLQGCIPVQIISGSTENPAEGAFFDLRFWGKALLEHDNARWVVFNFPSFGQGSGILVSSTIPNCHFDINAIGANE